jgi:hypothetical protein
MAVGFFTERCLGKKISKWNKWRLYPFPIAIEEVLAPYLLSCGLRHKGDLNNDCVVNLEDVVIMASDWLACGDPSSDWP